MEEEEEEEVSERKQIFFVVKNLVWIWFRIQQQPGSGSATLDLPVVTLDFTSLSLT
jgi:hypothetical protein